MLGSRDMYQGALKKEVPSGERVFIISIKGLSGLLVLVVL
jgi:hypothetical protein